MKKGLFRDDETPKKRKAATKGKKSLVKGSKKKMTKYKNDTIQISSKDKASKKCDIKATKKNRSDSSEDDDAECLYCGHIYSESTDGWVQCQDCQSWAHCGCAGVDDNDDKVIFVCKR